MGKGRWWSEGEDRWGSPLRWARSRLNERVTPPLRDEIARRIRSRVYTRTPGAIWRADAMHFGSVGVEAAGEAGFVPLTPTEQAWIEGQVAEQMARREEGQTR